MADPINRFNDLLRLERAEKDRKAHTKNDELRDMENMAGLTREEIAAQIAAAEARSDTKIARLEGKLDLVLTKLDDVREDGRHTRNNALLIGVSLALLIIGIVAAAPVIFDLGSKFRESVTKEVHDQLAPARLPPNTPK